MKFLKALFLSLYLMNHAYALDVPPLHERITDQVGILSESKKQELSGFLTAHESKTGNQVAVLIIPTLDGDSLEDFSIHVVDQWKLGKKGKDNGVLLLVVKNDRKLRIEVGYGLEGELTDAKTSQIIRNVILPQFKNGNFAQGIEDGLGAIIHVLDPQSAGPDLSDSEPQVAHSVHLPFSAQVILLILIIGFILVSRIFGLFLPRGYGSGGFWGGGFGGGGGGFSGGGGSFGGGGSSGSW